MEEKAREGMGGERRAHRRGVNDAPSPHSWIRSEGYLLTQNRPISHSVLSIYHLKSDLKELFMKMKLLLLGDKNTDSDYPFRR